MLVVTAWGWTATPDDARIAVHWGINGRPDGYMAKTTGLLLLPCIAAAMSALFTLLPAIEPRRANLIASRKLYLSGWYGGIGVVGITHLLTVMNAAGSHVDTPRGILIAVALLFVVVGNFLGKSHSTFFVGLRLPWTLSSEGAWEKSSRLTGRGLVATGCAALLVLLFVGAMPGVAVFATGAAISVTVGGVASYVYWKRDAGRHDGDSVHEQ
jgi:uncharacterized membrane protein